MKAVQVVGYHENLQLRDVEEPQLQGPLDVIVKIGAAGVCRTDIHILEGQWEAKSGVELPYAIGHENAGWVHAVGEAVTNVAVGDKVILHPLMTCGLCRACRRGRRALREQRLSRHRHERRVRGVPAHVGAQLRQARRLPGAGGRRGPGRRGPDRAARRGQGRQGAAPR